MTDLGRPGSSPRHDLAREARCVRAAALIAAVGTPPGRGGCMCGADGYLLAKLVSSYSCPAAERVLEASVEMAGKLAPGRQSGYGINAGAGPNGMSLRCPAARGAIVIDAG